jgi:predicted DNA-binding protein
MEVRMEKVKRMTFNIDAEKHDYLKVACAKMKITMTEFIINSSFEKLEDIEDCEDADKSMNDIEQGKEELLSLEEFKRELGL